MLTRLFAVSLFCLLTGCATTEPGSVSPYEYDRYACLPNSQHDAASVVSTMMNPVAYS